MPELITDLETIHRLAGEREDAYVRFRQFLKYRLTWSDRKLDDFVGWIAREVAAGIDCTQCANCCRVLEVSLDAEDISRLATRLEVSDAELDAQYATAGTSCARAFSDSPCAFLDGDRCSVYADRPRDCREYPHLDKGRFRERMWQLLTHAEDCPIIFNVLERLMVEIRESEHSIL